MKLEASVDIMSSLDHCQTLKSSESLLQIMGKKKSLLGRLQFGLPMFCLHANSHTSQQLSLLFVGKKSKMKHFCSLELFYLKRKNKRLRGRRRFLRLQKLIRGNWIQWMLILIECLIHTMTALRKGGKRSMLHCLIATGTVKAGGGKGGRRYASFPQSFSC